MDETWAECDHCGTCIRDGARSTGRLGVLCRECRALELEGHALADEIASGVDTSMLREGR